MLPPSRSTRSTESTPGSEPGPALDDEKCVEEWEEFLKSAPRLKRTIGAPAWFVYRLGRDPAPYTLCLFDGACWTRDLYSQVPGTHVYTGSKFPGHQMGRRYSVLDLFSAGSISAESISRVLGPIKHYPRLKLLNLREDPWRYLLYASLNPLLGNGINGSPTLGKHLEIPEKLPVSFQGEFGTRRSSYITAEEVRRFVESNNLKEAIVLDARSIGSMDSRVMSLTLAKHSPEFFSTHYEFRVKPSGWDSACVKVDRKNIFSYDGTKSMPRTTKGAQLRPASVRPLLSLVPPFEVPRFETIVVIGYYQKYSVAELAHALGSHCKALYLYRGDAFVVLPKVEEPTPKYSAPDSNT